MGQSQTSDSSSPSPSQAQQATMTNTSTPTSTTNNHNNNNNSSKRPFRDRTPITPFEQLIHQGTLASYEENKYKTLSCFNQAIQLEPKNHVGYLKRGIEFFNLMSKKRATEDFCMALDCVKQFPDCQSYDPNHEFHGRQMELILSGLVSEVNGKVDESYVAYEQATKLHIFSAAYLEAEKNQVGEIEEELRRLEAEFHRKTEELEAEARAQVERAMAAATAAHGFHAPTTITIAPTTAATGATGAATITTQGTTTTMTQNAPPPPPPPPMTAHGNGNNNNNNHHTFYMRVPPSYTRDELLEMEKQELRLKYELQRIEQYEDDLYTSYAYFSLGFVQFSKARFLEASHSYRRSIAFGPMNNTCIHHNNLGYCYEHLSRMDDAYEQYCQSMQSYDKCLKGMFNMAKVLNQEYKKFDEAMAMLNKIQAIDPSQQDVWIEKGEIYLNQDLVQEAEKCFEKAIRLDPGSSLAYIRLSSARLFQLLAKIDPHQSPDDLERYLQDSFYNQIVLPILRTAQDNMVDNQEYVRLLVFEKMITNSLQMTPQTDDSNTNNNNNNGGGGDDDDAIDDELEVLHDFEQQNYVKLLGEKYKYDPLETKYCTRFKRNMLSFLPSSSSSLDDGFSRSSNGVAQSTKNFVDVQILFQE